MRLIKRYPNRKYYDTEDKRYVSLNDIASLVRGGEDVEVIENSSGQDISTLILSQILREQERRGSFLPRPLLTSLVRRGTGGVKQLRRSFRASLQALQVLEDDVQEHIDKLAEQGEISLAEAQDLREELLVRARQSHAALETRILDEIEASFTRLSIPTNSDLERIKSQLEETEAKVGSLLANRKTGT